MGQPGLEHTAGGRTLAAMSAAITHRVTIDEIDAAGVMFAGTICTLAHRAYEQVLHHVGLDLMQDLLVGTVGQGAYEQVLHHVGLDLAEMVRAGGIALPLRALHADFRRPIHHGHELNISVAVAERRDHGYRVQITIAEATGGDVLAVIEQVHACLGPAGTKCALPATVLGALDRLPMVG